MTGSRGLRWLVDRRGEVGTVGWQGGRKTCLSFAATASHDHRRSQSLSVEYLHWATRAEPLGAGRIPSLVTALSRTGHPADVQWLYDPDRDEDVDYQPPADAVGPFHTADVALINHDPVTIIDHVQRGELPIIALRVHDAFQRSNGVVDSDDRGSDGHAVLAVGAATIDGALPSQGLSDGDPLILIRNSWGVGWGVQGHALLTPRTWSAVVLAALTVTPRSGAKTAP